MFLNKIFSGQKKGDAPSKRKQAAGAFRNRKTDKVHQKVNVEHLSIGMYVVELDIPWEQSDFMFQGFTINSITEIKALRRQCEYVFVHMNINKPIRRTNNEKSIPRPHFDTLPIEKEVDEASRIHTITKQTISDVFSSVRLGAEIDGVALKQAVSSCVESVMRNSDASIWLTMLRNKNEATAQHSLNVAALSVILGKSLGYSIGQLEDIGLCGSLHDIGKTQLPDELVNNEGTLSESEIEKMKLHTTLGRDILISNRTAMKGTADVAYCHHERPDGQGYPRGISADEIPHLANIVAIAETYDSMTTKQLWRPAWSPSEALKVLYAERGTQFDEELVIQFIDTIGIFPPGSIIEMNDGQIGIVLSNTSDKLRPRVILLLDTEHNPMKQTVIDLSKVSPANSQIRTTHHNGSFGIDIEEFQRAGLRFG